MKRFNYCWSTVLLLVCIAVRGDDPATTERHDPVYGGKALSKWIIDLKSDDDNVREDALESLCRYHPGPEAVSAVPVLIQLLTSKNSVNVINASHALSWIGKPAVPALLEAMKSQEPKVRAEVARTLGRIGDDAENSSPQLRYLWKDPSPDVRAAVATAYCLINGSDQDALAVLEDGLDKEDPKVRRMFVDAFQDLGILARPSVRKLRRLLKDDSYHVRCGAALAICECFPRDKQGMAALSNEITDSVGGASWALMRICDIGPDVRAVMPTLIKALSDKLSSNRQFAARAISEAGRFGNAAVPALTKLLEDEDEFGRSYSALALGNIGKEAVSADDALSKCLTDKVFLVQLEAATALVKIGGPGRQQGMDVLLKALDSEAESKRALTQLFFLGPSGAPSIPWLIRFVESGTLEQRRAAASCLSRIGPDSYVALPQLLKALADPDRDLQSNAFQAIRELGAKAKPAIPTLLNLLAHSNKDVRYYAAHTLGHVVRDPNDAKPIRRSLQDKDEGVRLEAAAALTRIAPNDVDALAYLRKTITDKNVKARISAAGVLTRAGKFNEVQSVFEEALSDKNWRTRRYAIDSLASIYPDRKEVVPLVVKHLCDANKLTRHHFEIQLLDKDPDLAKKSGID